MSIIFSDRRSTPPSIFCVEKGCKAGFVYAPLEAVFPVPVFPVVIYIADAVTCTLEVVFPTQHHIASKRLRNTLLPEVQQERQRHEGIGTPGRHPGERQVSARVGSAGGGAR